MSGPLTNAPTVIRKKPQPFNGRCFIDRYSGLRKIARRLRKPNKDGTFLSAIVASAAERGRHVHPYHKRTA